MLENTLPFTTQSLSRSSNIQLSPTRASPRLITPTKRQQRAQGPTARPGRGRRAKQEVLVVEELSLLSSSPGRITASVSPRKAPKKERRVMRWENEAGDMKREENEENCNIQ